MTPRLHINKLPVLYFDIQAVNQKRLKYMALVSKHIVESLSGRNEKSFTLDM